VLPKHDRCAARKIIEQSQNIGFISGIADEFLQRAILVVFG
jgi:hypothetical protein